MLLNCMCSRHDECWLFTATVRVSLWGHVRWLAPCSVLLLVRTRIPRQAKKVVTPDQLSAHALTTTEPERRSKAERIWNKMSGYDKQFF